MLQKGDPGSIDYRFCSTVDETLAVYSHLYREQQQLGLIPTQELFSRHIGSEKFRQVGFHHFCQSEVQGLLK